MQKNFEIRKINFFNQFHSWTFITRILNSCQKELPKQKIRETVTKILHDMVDDDIYPRIQKTENKLLLHFIFIKNNIEEHSVTESEMYLVEAQIGQFG